MMESECKIQSAKFKIMESAKRHHKFFILIFAFFIFLISGCASMKEIRTVETPDGVRWDAIKESGIRGEGSPGTFFMAEGPDARAIMHFKHNAFKVIWWSEFQSWTFISSPVFIVKWIDPDGNIFWEEEISADGGSFSKYEVYLPVWGSPAKNYPGLWRVDVYFRDRLIDQKNFIIVPYDPREIS